MTMNPYESPRTGRPSSPSARAGVCYNVKVGMSALDWAADQVEPGVSIANPDGPANEALMPLRLRRQPRRGAKRRAAGARAW